MKIHGMMLVRNEGSRLINNESIFTKVLFNMGHLCDTLTVLDDNSNDNTVDVIKTSLFAVKVIHEKDIKINIIENKEQKWNTNELDIRKQLWETTIEKAEHDDWIICLDADELLVNEHIPYLKYLLSTLSAEIDAVGFKLFDMWDNEHYRHDQYWSAHTRFFPMAIRYKADKEYVWHDKKLHCGRFPANGAKAMLPTQIPIKHMGWADAEERKIKYHRYMETDPNGIEGILEQYKSILDTNPNLIEFGRCPL